jgi:tRNA pseudouridine55 synthase
VREAPIDGVLVVDKPIGPTSHDVVGKIRRALGLRRVGHAGTLDPMASGVLVVLIGEGTKLAPYLTAHEKRYQARVVLGRSTTTLDAEGEIAEERAVPDDLAREIERAALHEATPRLGTALEAERKRTLQRPPEFSAIKVAGRRSYDRARSGEQFDLEPRPVEVFEVRLLSATRQEALLQLDFDLRVGKGYYVRSFARDFGAALDVPSHLGALRRTASGPFIVADAVHLASSPSDLRAAVRPLATAAAASMPVARLDEVGVDRARSGKRLDFSHFTEPPPPSNAPSAWLDPWGRLVAVGSLYQDHFVVQRGFSSGNCSMNSDGEDIDR